MSNPTLKARAMLLNREEHAMLELLLAINSMDQDGYLRGLRYRPLAPVPRKEYLCWNAMRIAVQLGYDAYDRAGWQAVLGQCCLMADIDYDKIAYCAMNFVTLADFLLPTEIA